MTMDSARDPVQPLRTMPHRVHARDHGEEHLRGADVARRLLAPDVLLARLERHAKRRPAVRVARHTDDATREQALEFVACREECRVRTTEAHRHTKTLRAT